LSDSLPGYLLFIFLEKNINQGDSHIVVSLFICNIYFSAQKKFISHEKSACPFILLVMFIIVKKIIARYNKTLKKIPRR